MFVRTVSFGLTAETPPSSGPGVVLAQPGPPTFAGEAAIVIVHGSVRVAAADIGDSDLRGESEILLSKKASGRRATSWPGPLAEYLLGRIDQAAVFVSATSGR